MTEGKHPGGRPSLYTGELAGEICQLIAEGNPLTEICKRDDMPDYRTVMRWRASNDEFRQMYAIAREDQADTLADEILGIADAPAVADTPDNVQRDRLRIDSRKWLAAKLRPKRYGEKTESTLLGDPEKPLQVDGSITVTFIKPNAD